MATEIERKFLVADPAAAIAAAASSVRIIQGYLSSDKEATVRVRMWGDKGFLTVKSQNRGAVRGEWEYEIPSSDARELLALSRTPIIDKTRYIIPYAGHTWELDVFSAPRALVMAEVELSDADELLDLPPWLGCEVTGNPNYYNSNIARNEPPA